MDEPLIYPDFKICQLEKCHKHLFVSKTLFILCAFILTKIENIEDLMNEAVFLILTDGLILKHVLF